MPAELRASIEAAAKSGKRSLNAEIIARLQETVDLEEVIQIVAPGAPVTGTHGLLQDMHNQIEELLDENQELQYSGQSQALAEHLSFNTQMLEKIESRIEYLIDQTKADKK